MRDLFDNIDDSMLAAADVQLRYSDTLPNSEFVIPERSPNARDTGRVVKQDGIKQFSGHEHQHDAEQSPDNGNAGAYDSPDAVSAAPTK